MQAIERADVRNVPIDRDLLLTFGSAASAGYHDPEPVLRTPDESTRHKTVYLDSSSVVFCQYIPGRLPGKYTTRNIVQQYLVRYWL